MKRSRYERVVETQREKENEVFTSKNSSIAGLKSIISAGHLFLKLTIKINLDLKNDKRRSGDIDTRMRTECAS